MNSPQGVGIKNTDTEIRDGVWSDGVKPDGADARKNTDDEIKNAVWSDGVKPDGASTGKNYFEQTVPLGINLSQTLNNTAGNKVFITADTRGAQGLVSTDDTKVEKVMLLITGIATNTYAGSNALDCSTATHNQWQIALGAGSWSDLVNGSNPDGQMNDDDWRCKVEGAAVSFSMMFDVTSQITDIDGNIGLQLENGRAEQDSLIVTISAFLKVLYHL